MIHESVIDSCLNRLSTHFGSLVRIRPPATAAELADLERTVGSLPRDLTIFLITCNGLRVVADNIDAELHLWDVHEMLAAIRDCSGSPVAAGLLPIRGESSGPRDCLVLSSGDVHGSVIRREAWAPGAELLSSSFGHYLDAWISFLIETFDASGRLQKKGVLTQFDAAYTAAKDPDANALRTAETTQEWLTQLDAGVSSGADFE